MSPISLVFSMIKEETIARLVEEKLQGSDKFIVGLRVSPDNHIEVSLDSDSQITLDDCAAVNRYITAHLDKEGADFSLQVSTAGLALKVPRQFPKNIGRQVKIVRNDGSVVQGKLTAAGNETVEVSYNQRETVPGRKKKQNITHTEIISYSSIASTQVQVSFK